MGDLSKTVVICDLTSNVAFRFEQLDGQQLLATKLDGQYHMLGKVTTVAHHLLTNILFRLKNLLEAMDCDKIFLPPLPRYLFKACCDQEGHCEGVGQEGYALELLQKSYGLRKHISDKLKAWHTRITVPDMLTKMFPEATSPARVLDELRRVTSADGVHLTDEGYRIWAKAMIDGVMQPKKDDSGSASAGAKPQQFFWRGFISPVGSERPKNMASFHNNRTHGGGKWERSKRTPSGARGGQPPYHKKRF